jgi:hypothetical protein
MRAYVIIATKGRAREAQRLIDCLERQTLQPNFVIITGTEERDIEGVNYRPLIVSGHGEAIVSPRIGLAAQRNCGIEFLERGGYFAPEKGQFFCAFFDDDYRLADDWLKRADERLEKGCIVGLTGQILADGVRTGGLTENQATAFLNGETPPQSHWASGVNERDTGSVYGCNMAFIDTVIRQTRFDENLPLYGWQEDRDYTGMAKKIGRVIYFPNCRGVHLGVKSGRTSGIKLGYSQIANPLYLMKKGTMEYRIGLKFIARALAANTVRSLSDHPFIDYRGQLRGNMRALLDVLLMRSHPSNILSIRAEFP